jgi:AAA15 family ATPase/GTPase
MDANNHLTSFSVENFKCFEAFELKNIRQFNLIAGDNNVGKTSLLEALLLDRDVIDTISRFRFLLGWRFADNPINVDSNKISILFRKEVNKPIKFTKTTIEFSNTYEYHFKYPRNGATSHSIEEFDDTDVEFLRQNIIGISPENQNTEHLILKQNNRTSFILPVSYKKEGGGFIPFFSPRIIYRFDLCGYWDRIVNDNFEEQFMRIFNSIFPEIEEVRNFNNDITNRGNVLKVRLKTTDKYVPLAMLGDGCVKFFRLLCLIFSAQSKIVLFDELDNGVHYLKLKSFIKELISFCNAYNVQLFATTHSKECIEAYSQAIYELDEETQNKAQYIRMEKLSSGRIIGRNYNYEQFSSSIELGNEIRS